jgi:hypothetical protein
VNESSPRLKVVLLYLNLLVCLIVAIDKEVGWMCGVCDCVGSRRKGVRCAAFVEPARIAVMGEGT